MCVLITAGDTVTKADYYTTIEEQHMFAKAFPEMVALFHQDTKGKKKQKCRQKGLMFTSVLHLLVISAK